MTLSRLAFALFSMNFLDSCLDKGTQGSNCTVLYRLPTSVQTNFTVLATQPKSCPIFVQGASQPVPTPTAATLRMTEILRPDDGLVHYAHVDRIGIVRFTSTTPWFPGSGGTAVSNFSSVLSVGEAGYEPGMSGSGDRLNMRSDVYQNSEDIEASPVLSYDRMLAASVTAVPDNPVANQVVELSVHVPPSEFVPPLRYLWYKDGDYVGEFGSSLSVVSGAANVMTQYRVVVTASDFKQTIGTVYFQTQPTGCGATPNCNDQ